MHRRLRIDFARPSGNLFLDVHLMVVLSSLENLSRFSTRRLLSNVPSLMTSLCLCNENSPLSKSPPHFHCRNGRSHFRGGDNSLMTLLYRSLAREQTRVCASLLRRPDHTQLRSTWRLRSRRRAASCTVADVRRPITTPCAQLFVGLIGTS